jgi:hypothetical protein
VAGVAQDMLQVLVAQAELEAYMAVQEEGVAHLEMDLTAEKVVMVRAD